jgi:hypothetical protein
VNSTSLSTLASCWQHRAACSTTSKQNNNGAAEQHQQSAVKQLTVPSLAPPQVPFSLSTESLLRKKGPMVPCQSEKEHISTALLSVARRCPCAQRSQLWCGSRAVYCCPEPLSCPTLSLPTGPSLPHLNPQLPQALMQLVQVHQQPASGLLRGQRSSLTSSTSLGLPAGVRQDSSTRQQYKTTVHSTSADSQAGQH